MAEPTQDQVRGHSFDGIEEYDNRLPNWWLWILYGTIVFSIGYWLAFQTVSLFPQPKDRLAADMKRAQEAQLARMAEGGPSNESLNMLAGMADKVAEGRKLFQTHCVACHADQGQGLVGPNLTDPNWIHGGAPVDIHRTVTEGVAAKGMPAWGSQLGPQRVDLVVAYVLSIRNTNVAGKAPEGDVYTGE